MCDSLSRFLVVFVFLSFLFSYLLFPVVHPWTCARERPPLEPMFLPFVLSTPRPHEPTSYDRPCVHLVCLAHMLSEPPFES